MASVIWLKVKLKKAYFISVDIEDFVPHMMARSPGFATVDDGLDRNSSEKSKSSALGY